MTKEKHVLSLESLFSICRYLYPASEEWPDVREVHKHDLTREVMLFSRLAPYLDQAYDQFTDADAPEILCKAIEAARADGMQIPQLTVETGYRIKSVKIVPNGEKLETLSSIVPDRYLSPNNKLINIMTKKDVVDGNEFEIEVGTKKKPIKTTCTLSFKGESNIKLSGQFTEYDRIVLSAAATLYELGDQSHNMTSAMIYRAMTGLTETEKPTAGQIAAVTRSMDKQRFINASADISAELKARGITYESHQIQQGIFDTYLIAAERLTIKAGGKTTHAYHLLRPPVLYEYAAATNQVLNLPSSLLDVKEINKDGSTGSRLPNTNTRIVLKDYLLRRIEGMKGKNNLKSHSIALCDYERNGENHKGLYSIAGFSEDVSRTEANRIRTDTEKMLAYWKAVGYIKGFSAQKKGKRITGYEIQV